MLEPAQSSLSTHRHWYRIAASGHWASHWCWECLAALLQCQHQQFALEAVGLRIGPLIFCYLHWPEHRWEVAPTGSHQPSQVLSSHKHPLLCICKTPYAPWALRNIPLHTESIRNASEHFETKLPGSIINRDSEAFTMLLVLYLRPDAAPGAMAPSSIMTGPPLTLNLIFIFHEKMAVILFYLIGQPNPNLRGGRQDNWLALHPTQDRRQLELTGGGWVVRWCLFPNPGISPMQALWRCLALHQQNCWHKFEMPISGPCDLEMGIRIRLNGQSWTPPPSPGQSTHGPPSPHSVPPPPPFSCLLTTLQSSHAGWTWTVWGLLTCWFPLGQLCSLWILHWLKPHVLAQGVVGIAPILREFKF